MFLFPFFLTLESLFFDPMTPQKYNSYQLVNNPINNSTPIDVAMSVNPGPSGTGGCGGGNSGGGGGGPCGACKFLRRKCVPGCVFAPHFDSEQGATHFAAVHKVFGASNVSKLLSSIPVHRRQDAVLTVCYEAQARVRHPVYGCVAHIFALQQQVMTLQAELSFLQAHVGSMTDLPRPHQSSPPQPPAAIEPPISSPNAIYAQPPYDISSPFDPIISQQASWAAMQHPIDPRQPVGLPSSIADLQALACELIRRQGNQLGPTSSSPSIHKKE